ncbi:hypothetical protein ASE72_19280 [Sphingomonas sp. Leaf20]|nr:hypothetical protein ASE72_19280 [Sphingomonas sp. Leaf20]
MVWAVLSDRPNSREEKVLRRLCLGDIEVAAKFTGIGELTFESMLYKGWIEQAHDDDYGEDGLRITALGQEAFARTGRG